MLKNRVALLSDSLRNAIFFFLWAIYRFSLKVLVKGKKTRKEFQYTGTTKDDEFDRRALIMTLSSFFPTTLMDIVELNMRNALVDSFIPETKIVEFLRNLKGDLFVDVGANIGRYTTMLHRNFRRIIALEPFPLNMEFLHKNIRYKKLRNITCIEAAVSDKNSTTVFYPSSSGFLEHSLIKPKSARRFAKSILVKTYNLDFLLKNEKRVDLVKVDVEGAEWQVLEGAKQILDKVQSWVIELHDLDKKKEIERWFISRGYEIRWLDFMHIYAHRNSRKKG